VDSKRVIEEALRLPADARAALAGELLASLEGDEVDSGREAAWAAEIQERVTAWQRGDVASVSIEEFVTKLDAAVSGKPAP
jgi:putative addiction module component (TIGR02574 family)